MLLSGKQPQVAMLLQRAGQQITIREPDGSETLNNFGKEDDTDLSFSEVSTDEYAYRVTSNTDELIGTATTTGGRVDQQHPLLLLLGDSQVEQGFLVDFPDNLTYHISDPVQDRVAYKSVHATLYTE